MTEIKDRIAEVDAFGRELANKINGRIVDEDLKGQSPATIKRVEELIEAEVASHPTFTFEEDNEVLAGDFEFTIMRGGIAAAPLVTVTRYLGRVGAPPEPRRRTPEVRERPL